MCEETEKKWPEEYSRYSSSLTSVFVLKAASISPSTALSMSAVSNTMKGQDDPTQTDTETGIPHPAAASHNSAPF